MKSIRKRDGRVVPWDRSKIAIAISKAVEAVGGNDYETPEKLAFEVEQQIGQSLGKNWDTADIEFVQNLVEKTLVESGHYLTAKAYILYRQKREEGRAIAQVIQSNNEKVLQYLGGTDWRVKENSNMTFSVQGMNVRVAGDITELFWMHQIYSEEIRLGHANGWYHVHDTNFLGPYCVGWDLKDLLTVGFRGVRGKVASKPPKHFRAALGQMVNFLYTLQGEAAGAQAFSNMDTLLAPFIRYDKLEYQQVKQAVQEFMFNMNVPTRVGFQTPFTNVTMDLKVPKHMKDEPVLIGGKMMDETYGDFQAEMDMFNRAFSEVMMEGDGQERLFTFPIPTYNITEDFDWDNPNHDLLWKITGKFGIPTFSNYVNSDMDPEDARSMCCRLRLDNRELLKRGGGLFGSSPLTGSIGVVTINMNRIGMVSACKEKFFSKLEECMDLAMQSLEMKRKVLEDLTERGLYPYSKYYLRGVKERSGQYWTNHFSTIGLIGMNESCLAYMKEDIGSKNGKAFALEVLDFMRDKMVAYQEKSGNLFNLEATPGEGASYSLAEKDRKIWGDQIPVYYTNSTQLPVDYTNDLFCALNHQDDLQAKYTGGTTFHIFLGEAVSDPGAIKKLVKKVCSGYNLPYFTITPTFSICPEHGYLKGKVEICPHCAAEGEATQCEVYSRVVGYIRPVDQFNKGKQKEFAEREVYDGAVG